MKYDLSMSIEILERTPEVLDTLLVGLSDEWLHGDEGLNTWSPFQVVGHLIVNEETNFLPRTLLILSGPETKILQRIDMTSHIDRFRGKRIEDLISQFRRLRNENIKKLKALEVTADDLETNAIHPKVGNVALSNILATWVAHDLVHIGQVTRVMAKQYREEVGPFIEFLPRIK